ncbi:hypothetical protein GGS21DRAFT_530412 [Xylaria nigripes]|nr:hypothetical protein GGS21DRAFT_530412 [Xylaria nigripes]
MSPSNERPPNPVPVPVPVSGSVAATATSTGPGQSSVTGTAVLTRRRRPVTGSAVSSGETIAPEVDLTEKPPDDPVAMSWTARNQWIVYAIASGACAAFNGVFAKLTTNDLTTHIARGISGAIGLKDLGPALEVAVRITFFGLNLVFNGVMWTLFTQALAKGNSTTQVSVMNTSTNFVITALLGLAIFAESLPPLWWAGATLLVAGNVIIGRQNEGEEANAEAEEAEEAAEEGLGGISDTEFKDDPVDDDVPQIGNLDDSRDV